MEENVSCEDERTVKMQKCSNRKSTKKRVVQEEDEDASGDNDDDASGDNDDDEEPSKGDSSGIEDSDDEETERKKVSKVILKMQVVVIFPDPKCSMVFGHFKKCNESNNESD